MQLVRVLFVSLFLLQASASVASELQCEGDECDAEMLEEEEEVSILQSRVHQHQHGQFDVDGQNVDHRLGRFSKLTVEGVDDNEGPCKVEGVWHDEHGSIEFLTSDNLLSFTVPGIPSFKQHLEKKDGASQLIALEIGGVKISSAEESEGDKMMVAFNALANSTSYMRRGKSLSSLLGKNGLPGTRAACVMRLHLTLASLDKASVKVELSGTPAWASAALVSRRRAIVSSATGPYGFADVCLPTMTPEWTCGLGSATNLAPGSAALNTVLQYARATLLTNVQCVGTTANSGCIGLCGNGCDCWESICSSTYDCGYNRYCCAHDLSCMRRRLGSILKCLNPTVNSHC